MDEEDIRLECEFYSIDLHSFAPLSDAAICAWKEKMQTSEMAKAWSRVPELELIKVMSLG